MPPPASPDTAPETDGTWFTPSRTALAVGGGLTLIGAGIGTGLLVSAHDADKQFLDLRRQMQRDGVDCRSGTEECSRLSNLSEQRHQDYNGSLVAFAAAGVSAIATVGVAAWLRGEDAPPNEVDAARTPSPYSFALNMTSEALTLVVSF